jgi:hypothetical protein
MGKSPGKRALSPSTCHREANRGANFFLIHGSFPLPGYMYLYSFGRRAG